jgi:ATP-dependent Clp protease adaptor protein ClpS
MSTEEVVVEKKKVVNKDIKPPSKYKVMVLNDDVTPMDFVILMLITIFKKPQEEAVQLTLKIHHEGSAIAGIYPHEIAEQKVADGVTMARNNGFPLMLKAEVE